MDFEPSMPIYLQIIAKIREKVASGVWAPGERIDAVRDLAAAFSVNPNTMQRALAELEREGLLKTERTAGRFVTTDTAFIASVRDALAEELAARLTGELRRLGLSPGEILDAVNKHLYREGQG